MRNISLLIVAAIALTSLAACSSIHGVELPAPPAAVKPVPIPQQHVTHALEIISVLAFVALGVFVGLLFTPLSLVSKLGIPISGSVAVISYAGILVIPFVKWILPVAIVGLVIYELIVNDALSAGLSAAVAKLLGRVEKLVAPLETEAEKIFGLKPPASTPALPPAGSTSSPQALNPTTTHYPINASANLPAPVNG
jgi:hypothetical protein